MRVISDILWVLIIDLVKSFDSKLAGFFTWTNIISPKCKIKALLSTGGIITLYLTY